jgi:alginate lyase
MTPAWLTHAVRLLLHAALLVSLGAVRADPSRDSPVPGNKPFLHPGLLNSSAELNFIKSRLRIHGEPWQAAFSKLKSSNFASLQWTPKPRRIVDVGYFNKPDIGGSDELNDSTSAYANALIWMLTDDEKHAQKATEILSAWSAMLQTHTGNNGRLQAAWAGCMFPLSAEILRSTYPGWTKEASANLTSMFNRAFVPLLTDDIPLTNGNWDLSMSNALIAIGVFNEDRATYDQGVFRWRKRVPAYFYLSGDGALPIPPDRVEIMASYAYWHNPGRFVDGLCQETGRDLGHVQMGLAAAINAAEIAYHQGLNLYGEQRVRITKAMEFHADYLLGNPVPPWLCGGKLNMGTDINATWEIGYNHLHNRAGLEMPATLKFIKDKVRPWPETSFRNTVGIDTLTHAELGAEPAR